MRSTPRRPGTRPALRWRAAGSGSLFRLRPRQTPFVCPDVGAVSANDGPRRAASGECRRRFSQGCRLLRHHALCLGPSWRSAGRYLHQPEAHHPLHGEADQRRIQCPFNPGFEHPVVRSRNSRGPTLPRQGSCATAAMRPDEPLIGQARRPAAGRRDGLRCPERYPSWSGSRPMSSLRARWSSSSGKYVFAGLRMPAPIRARPFQPDPLTIALSDRPGACDMSSSATTDLALAGQRDSAAVPSRSQGVAAALDAEKPAVHVAQKYLRRIRHDGLDLGCAPRAIGQ